jgi:group I intron endonuclease
MFLPPPRGGGNGVYCFQNKETKEIVYVGSSVNLAKRFAEHAGVYTPSKSNILLIKAFKKYGLDKFVFIIIELYLFDETLKRVDNISELVKLPPPPPKGGADLLGFKHSDESKAKMRAAHAARDPSIQATISKAEGAQPPRAPATAGPLFHNLMRKKGTS